MVLATKTQQVPARDAQSFQKVEPIHETCKPNLWRRTLTRMKTAAAALAAVAVIATAAPLKADEEISPSSWRANSALRTLNSMRLADYSLVPSKWEFASLTDPSQSSSGALLMLHTSALSEFSLSPNYPRQLRLFEAGLGLGINLEPVTFGVVALITPFYERGVNWAASSFEGRHYTRQGSFVDLGAFLAADVYKKDDTTMTLQFGVTTVPDLEKSGDRCTLSTDVMPYIGFSIKF